MPAWRYPKEQGRTGVEYVVASGGEIARMGGELLKIELGDGDSGNMRFRLAKVPRTLGAVSSACDKGNRVVFDSAGSSV